MADVLHWSTLKCMSEYKTFSILLRFYITLKLMKLLTNVNIAMWERFFPTNNIKIEDKGKV